MPEYTLYELTCAGGMRDRFSPFTWRAKSDLALVGIPYTTVPYTFPQIRNDLAQATGDNDVTVPTLWCKEDGYITDSVNVADYLDKQKPGILFPSQDSRALAYFLDRWADTELSVVVRGLFRPLVYLRMDKTSRDYFIAVKNGDARSAPGRICREIEALDNPAAVDALAEAARAKLLIFEQLLARTEAQGPFVLGANPSHADSAVFAWYASTQLNAATVNRLVWQHESLPNIARWATAMEKAVGWQSPFEETVVTAEQKKELLDELKAM